VLRWSYALVVAGIVSGFAFLLLTGYYDNDGPVVIELSAKHGLHAGDLFVIAGWAVAMGALVLLARGSVAHAPGGLRAQPEPKSIEPATNDGRDANGKTPTAVRLSPVDGSPRSGP
jgi:hypothetical protein